MLNLNQYRIWDVHCHLAGLAGETPWQRMARLLEYADRMQIERLCVFMGMRFVYEPTPDDLRRQNDEVLEALAHYHDRAFGFCYVSPQHVAVSLEEMDRCIANGPMVGIKLWVAGRCSEAALDPIVVRAIALKAVILQHTWLKTDGSQLSGESTASDLAVLASRHPEASFVCGHTGGQFESGIRAVRASPNIWVETGGGDPTMGWLEMAVRELGQERVLFGSDAAGRSFATQLAKVVGADISDDARHAIFGVNLRRLLRPIMQHKGWGAATAMIDVNVLLPPWPFRWLPVRDAADLAKALAARGIQQAWVGGAEACFARDIAGANQRLADACQAVTTVDLVPWGTVNPLVPDWREDVRRCKEVHGMPGIRLLPSCHGYTLDAEQVSELIAAASETQLVIQIVFEWEDIRTQHPVFRIPPVDPQPLGRFVRENPQAKLLLLNAHRQIRIDAARDLAAAGQVYFDLAMLEGVDRVNSLVAAVGADRVVFGSGFPLFYLESGLLKLQETTLPPSAVQRIAHDNALQIVQW